MAANKASIHIKSPLEIEYESKGYVLSDPIDLDGDEEPDQTASSQNNIQQQVAQQYGENWLKQKWGLTPKGSFASSAGSAGQGGASQLSGASMSGSGGGSAGGMGAMGIGAIIAAAIAAQHAASNNTDTVFEGQKTNDAFSGNFGTEPWFAWLSDKMDWEPTAGEKFDAAVNNKDWGLAAKRMPAMADYWADPARSWGDTLTREYISEDVADVMNPVGWLTRKIAD